MAKIKSMKTVFENNDELILHMTTFDSKDKKKVKVLELCYAEYQKGNYGDVIPTEGAHHFMSCGVEYFRMENFEKAMIAFIRRSNNDKPSKSTVLSESIQDILN